MSRAPARAENRSETRREISSPDGVVRFLLERSAAGVQVQREELRPGGSRVAHAVLFPSAAAFARFCDADCLRLDYPHLYHRIKREFDELVSAHA